jgi:allantoin racemase
LKNLRKQNLGLRIKVIVPVLKGIWEDITEKELCSIAQPTTEIEVRGLEYGPKSVECEYDECLAAIGILNEVKKAERQGFDAVVINCFADPAIHAARELVRIPVVAPAWSSMFLASLLGRVFTIILPKIFGLGALGIVERLAKNYGFDNKLASVRYVNVEVLDFLKSRNLLEKALLNEAKKAIEEDGADVIILGCTGMIVVARFLSQALPAPVIEPSSAALKVAEMLVDLKMSHSKLSYSLPPSKLREYSLE